MKRLMISLLGVVLTGMPALAAVAQAADQPQDNMAAQETTQEAATQTDQDKANKASVHDANCLRHTGSRIAPRADKQGRKCLPVAGRSYTRDDIDRTGEIDLADALRKLDTSIY